MSHLIAGYPSLCDSETLALTLAGSGTDYLEIQLPFSDPIADGPQIARANAEALKKGATTAKCLKMVARLRQKTSAGKTKIILMTYYNVVFKYGMESFCREAEKAGVFGLIVPDFPYDHEKTDGLMKACKRHSIALILVIAPNTRPARLKAVLKNARGFVYCVARAGTTGKKTTIDQKILCYLQRVRRLTALPLAVGFGISAKSQLNALTGYADIAVIGSALLKEYQNKPLGAGVEAVQRFIERICATTIL